ncbi:uncharacterized protein RHOBADRAFT_51340 [Rhodotorula graminis WP1]|uniref:BHLH domain-containing protein n=1 Tax=Rhodotorula graminis (strain WP1) TaxID=578459 RepID=A0A194SAL0_RHOGW|nr:uncharacterized protein RHOBADRAFT_51340 [Rhodotorula graminis WP1]KPV77495.1 hypothetical protein RHOBADRAFT_51340 [Rhodotorula graminis WP1]
MNGEANFRPWSSLANQAALGGGRVDAAFLTEPVPYEDFEYSTGIDYPAFAAPPPPPGSSSSTTGASHLFRPFSPFHAHTGASSPRSRTASFPAAPPPPSGGAPEPAPLFDSTESALFSSFLTTLDVDPAFLFNPVLPPGMPSPPSTSAGPYGGGASERDRHERDSLGRDVGGMHLRASTTSAETGSSTTSAGSTPRSSFGVVGTAAAPYGAHLPPATLTAGPPLPPPTTLTAGPPPPPPLSLRLPTPPRAPSDSSEPRVHGRARGVTAARYAELDEDDDEDGAAAAAARDSDSDFEPAREPGAASGSASGASGAAASAGLRRRTRTSGGAAAAATAATGGGSRRGSKKARVSEPAPAPAHEAGGDVEMDVLDDEAALAAGLAAGRAKRSAASARRSGGRASLSRLPEPVADYGALDGGVDGSSTGAASHAPPTASTSAAAAAAAPAPTRSGNGKPVTLTESQKRSNHILSEQKRRNAIRIGFKDLVGLLLAGEAASGIVLGSGSGAAGDDDDEGAASTAKKRKSKGTGSGRGRGRRGDVSTNASKSVVLTHAASYILWLERGNMALEQEVARVEALLREA